MIKEVGNGITRDDNKRNWIDQNNIVFGYDDSRQCCEDWGWGVYDPATGEKVADSPADMPYHFVFDEGAKENDGEPFFKERIPYSPYDGPTDWVKVTLESDIVQGKKLIFECWLTHNGYYYHDFSFYKNETKEKKVRNF